ncbi:MAG TPA: surface-adhesin E family protein, partial [Longimicrobium sp.]|nr:surface-adhesin E family protein [Longimicrobium sp.]
TDAVDGGYGAQQWTPIAEGASGVLYADTRELPPSGISTRRLWVRWHSAEDDAGMGLLAGQAVEWEMEFDCQPALVRTWHTLIYAPDGQLQHVDASRPYAWAQVAEGALEQFAWQQACSDPQQ